MIIDWLTILFLTRRIGFRLFFSEEKEREKVLISVIVGRGPKLQRPIFTSIIPGNEGIPLNHAENL